MINEAKAAKTIPLSKGTLFNDSLPGVTLDAREPQALRHDISVVNIGIIGLDPGFVGSTQVELVYRFNTAGLCVHEVETHRSSAELLGVHLDLEQQHIQITHSRYGKVRFGLNALLRRNSCTCQCMKVSVGQYTFFALVQRDALATFHDVYFSSVRVITLTRKCGTRCAESANISVVSCLSHIQNGAPFSCTAHASDASDEAWFAVACERKHAFVASTQYQPALTHQVSLRMLGYKWSAVAAALPDYDSEAFPC